MAMRSELLRAVASIAFLSISGGCAEPRASPCAPSQLTLEEAKQLVLLVPAALDVIVPGGPPFAVEEDPPPNMNGYFDFMLIHEIDPDGPGSAILGYYFVSKSTGRVQSAFLDQEEVGGKLQRLQLKLRTTHCIRPDMVRKEQGLEQ